MKNLISPLFICLEGVVLPTRKPDRTYWFVDRATKQTSTSAFGWGSNCG